MPQAVEAAATASAEEPCRKNPPSATRIFPRGYMLPVVPWEVEYTDEFKKWWQALAEGQQDDVAARVELLADVGPNLPHPYSSSIRSSRHGVMRELRAQSAGRPIRVFYAFDPRRTSILLIGGDKAGNDRFYEEYVPVADDLYDEHLDELRQEGLIE